MRRSAIESRIANAVLHRAATEGCDTPVFTMSGCSRDRYLRGVLQRRPVRHYRIWRGSSPRAVPL